MRSISLPFLLVLALLFLSTGRVLAGTDPLVTKVLDGSLNQLRKDSFNIVEDSKFFDPAYNSKLVKPYPVENRVTWKINETSPYRIQSDFKARITVRIYITNANNQIDSTTVIDSVQYSGTNVYRNIACHTYSNGYRVKVKVIDTSSNVTGWNVWNVVQISNELQSYPAYTFSCTNDAIQTVNHAALDSSTTGDELNVSWGTVLPADIYDLEWTYIDSSALADHRYGSNPSSPDPTLIFENSTSRVTITGTSYNIPLMYDGAGHLFFRVRPVQMQGGGGRMEAHWSSDYSGGLGRFYFKGHQRNLNWQATSSYAEEGKRKVVVQYYDGSLRGRQTVTKDNSTNTVLVAESFYDYQGRPAIQVLPAPTISTVISYAQHFNMGLNGIGSYAGYDKNNFDSLSDPSQYCMNKADSMSVLSGASQYYSPNNPLKDSGFNRFIPDAKGYPFTQTQYTQDNTGRISRQSGVDSFHQVGSGHETVYYYGTPDQRQLDALFGTEVGDHSHYYKTMVRDANGQYSVSYTDMHGRTIATALAGSLPSDIKLDTLASNIKTTITENLLDSASVAIKDLVMESKKGLLVALAGYHVFSYTLSPQSLQLKDCNNNTVCYDCLYDLEISITDDCNNQKMAFDTVVRNFTLSGIDASCNASGFSVSFTKWLPEGSYEITKKLSVSRYGAGYYRDSIFVKKNTCKTQAGTIQEQRALLAATMMQCQPSCSSCKDSLGAWSTFRSRFMQRAGIDAADTAASRNLAWQAYQEALANCRLLCDSVSDFDDIRQQMLLDLSPQSGQYAILDNAQDKYSIFYTDRYINGENNPSAHDTIADYQKAVNYVDENGNVDMVYDETTGGLVHPQDLSAESFAGKFKLSWAEALLPYHPEYCKLQQYEALLPSTQWDKEFESTDTYQDAMNKGYLNPTNKNWPPFNKYNATGTANPDPLASFSGHDYRTGLETKLNNYSGDLQGHAGLTIWQVATASVRCAGKDSTCIFNYANHDSAFNSNMCTGDLDMAWRSFRQMYLDIKRKLINDEIKINSSCTSIPAPTAQQLTLAGHQPHFSDALELLQANGVTPPSNISGAYASRQDAQNTAAAYGNDNCVAYVKMWWQQLAPCNYNSTDSATIIPQLIQVCKEGSDGSHLYGASSVAPSSTYQYKSFEEVIDSYNQAHNIAKVNCNAYNIKAPKPYDQQLVYGNKPVWTRPDSCDCNRIAELYAQYQSVSSSYTSFSNFLLQVYKTVISDSALNILQTKCSTENALCSYLASPVMLPPALQCNSGDVCASCLLVQTLYKQFQVRYPSLTPAYIATDSVSSNNNLLFENYMNYKLGFAKQARDYLTFLNQCTKQQINVYSLQAILDSGRAAYRARFGTLGKVIQFGTQEGQVFKNLHDIVDSGVIHLPDAVRQSPGNWYNNTQLTQYGGTYCWDSGYAVELRLKFLEDIVPWIVQGDIFYINTGNFGVVFDRYSSPFNGNAAGTYLVAILDGATNSYLWTGYALASSNPDALKDWCNVKVQMEPSSYSVYFNGSLVKSISRNPSTVLIHKNFFVLGLLGRQGALDWAKYYNRYGEVKYFEDFKNPDDIAVEAYDYFCPSPSFDCNTLFRTTFNNLLGTSYTFSQIDSIYNAFGLPMNVCGGVGDTALYTIPASPPPPMITSLTLCGRSGPVFPQVAPEEVNNCSDSSFFAVSKGMEIYNSYSDSLNNSFDSSYRSKCLQAYKYERFTVRHQNSEYHYTLYYYDQAGNLLKTVPPAGVRANYDSLWLDSVAAARAIAQAKVPAHTLITQYRYNTLNQVAAQQTPDAGRSLFWYDRLGRLALSQNAKQKSAAVTETGRQYSYTLYDYLGRITEVGQIGNAGSTVMTDSISRNPSLLDSWMLVSTANKEQITQTVYDVAYNGFTGYNPLPITQRNLRNRVSYTTITNGSNPASYNQASMYTYDISGNVDTLLQDYGSSSFTATQNFMNLHGNHRFKKLAYNYDLISGKVNQMQYQPGMTDLWIHNYTYDAENRLIQVQTSRDSTLWQTDARYQYYKHGPLARVVLGDQQVQGIDYAYTLQGWLKGVNSIAVDYLRDMGGDALTGGVNQNTAKDVYGFALNYYTGDYAPINGAVSPFPGYMSSLPANTYKPLYNGNISSMAVTMDPLAATGTGGRTLFYNYTYDQLNRLTGQDVLNGFNTSSNSWDTTMTALKQFQERITYDANGNILKYLRTSNSSASNPRMDSLSYQYYAGTNRLQKIRDSVPAGVSGTYLDIDDQPVNNYGYDDIGNLIKDSSESITGVKWSVYGKPLEITRTATSGNTLTKLTYTYDAQGNRIGKTVQGTGSTLSYTWYVRDAQGNLLCMYTGSGTSPSASGVNASKWMMYGSGRLGTYNYQVGMNGGAGSIATAHGFDDRREVRFYELTNHLGSELVTVTDRKTAVPLPANSSLISYYVAEAANAQEYTPFGQRTPGRLFTVGSGFNTMYGFNGKEKDNELKGEWNSYDYGERFYDPRAGRFLSVDPLSKSYPWYTPYQFAGNNPIKFIDLDGLEPAEPGKKAGEVQTGTTGNGPAQSWKWDGNKWQDNSALSEVIVSAKRKGYNDIVREHPQVALSVSGAYSTALSLYTGKYNTYGSVSADIMKNLTEERKKKDFATNAPRTNAILIWEFLTGTGPENRAFDESSPITQEIKGSESARLASWQMANDYLRGNFADGQTKQYYIGMAPGPGIGNMESIRRHLNAWTTSPSSFYRGGMTFTMTRAGYDVKVKVTDAYTIYSMIRVNANVTRIPGKVTPLGKTTVEFNFTYKDALKR